MGDSGEAGGESRAGQVGQIVQASKAIQQTSFGRERNKSPSPAGLRE
jgi:hypothetical protein